MRLAVTGRLGAAESMLAMMRSRIRGGFALKVAGMESALKVLEARIASADPRKVLERGYVLAVDGSGVVLKSASGAVAGQEISVMFADGRLDCDVRAVKYKEE